MEQTCGLALAENSVDTELNLTRKPRGSIFMDDSYPSFRPKNTRIISARRVSIKFKSEPNRLEFVHHYSIANFKLGLRETSPLAYGSPIH
jgi:hypothetical protein